MDHKNCPDSCPVKVKELMAAVGYWTYQCLEARTVANKLKQYIDSSTKKRESGVILG